LFVQENNASTPFLVGILAQEINNLPGTQPSMITRVTTIINALEALLRSDAQFMAEGMWQAVTLVNYIEPNSAAHVAFDLLRRGKKRCELNFENLVLMLMSSTAAETLA
jgi:hypothetical protein